MVVAFLRLPPASASATTRIKVPDSNPDVFDVAARYPGSKQLRRAVAPPAAAPVEATWDAKPVIKTVRGVQYELFTVGQLGQALGGRAAVTMRLWEREGVIPKARMRLPNKNGIGGRRYYTRPQVEGMRRIAEEEGLLEPRARLSPRFTERCVQLFRDLEQQ